MGSGSRATMGWILTIALSWLFYAGIQDGGFQSMFCEWVLKHYSFFPEKFWQTPTYWKLRGRRWHHVTHEDVSWEINIDGILILVQHGGPIFTLFIVLAINLVVLCILTQSPFSSSLWTTGCLRRKYRRLWSLWSYSSQMVIIYAASLERQVVGQKRNR